MEKKRSGILVLVFVLIISFLPGDFGFAQGGIGNTFALQQAERLLEKLSPEEKVGQLFLITFDGAEIEEDSEIYSLILDYYVGGVFLKHSNSNIPDTNAESGLRNLITNLQSSMEGTAKLPLEDGGDISVNRFIPLFISTSQPGGGYPYDQILNGLTSAPSPMAIGATWDLSNAEKIGEVLGSELESLGFNLLLSPSMDVLDNSYIEEQMGLGVRSFGGDPFWVAEMGAAYISGLHRGSGGRLAVVAGSFPGSGSSDRIPDEEVATIRKSLEQLKLVELAPFFKITDFTTSLPAAITDGLLTSHIRYQGLQGNIRATTKPVSFDKNALDLLMGLEPLKSWKQSGGLLISDDLGSLAVEKFFNPDGQYIDARQVVKNAFLAGNDVLFMDNLLSTGDKDRFETYIKTIELFVEKYKEDSAFAERVDISVLRILTLKYDLYGEFTLDRVIPDANFFPIPLSVLDMSFQTASRAATLVNPSPEQLRDLIPNPPQFGERIIIFTDDQIVVPCEECEAQKVFPVDGLQNSLLNLYGPDGSGQIASTQIISYSFRDLADFVIDPFNRPELGQNLSRSYWVLFAVREIKSDEPNSFALNNLIAENPVVLREKNVIVFSFDAPYYFDATEISEISAFYVLYSKLPAFLDVAARIVFQEISPSGSSPVSIPGIRYDMMERIAPNPTQIIPLSVDEEAAAALQIEPQGNSSPLPETLAFKLGDVLPVMTGVIEDNNGNLVPDGTIVQFTMHQQNDTTTMQQIESSTIGGVARASFSLLNPGIHEIRVESDPAYNSEILVLDITEEATTVSAIIPTPLPVVSETAIVQENQSLVVEEPNPDPNKKLLEWLIGVVVSILMGYLIYFFLKDYFTVTDNFQISGTAVVGGLVNMVWLILNLPGTQPRFELKGYSRFMLVIVFGALMGSIVGWLILRYKRSGLKDQGSE